MQLDLDNREFQLAFDLIQNTNKSFFLTGKAGTGKSTFLQYFVKNIKKNFIVVAPTGIAAINAYGVTIHSFFQLEPRPFLPDDPDIKLFGKGSQKRKIIETLDTLFIDEVSMVRADLLNAIDLSLRRNGGDPNLPFGGKQVVLIGDAFQLPPVVKSDSGDQKIINQFYGSPFFFNSDLFDKLGLLTIELKKVYRQSDPLFISLLDRIRVAEIEQQDIEMFNSRLIIDEELEQQEFAITLTTRNDIAAQVNSTKLRNLDAKEFNFEAEIEGDFDSSSYPTDSELFFKVGAQVIFVKNDLKKRWVNGTIGRVEKLTKSRIRVALEDGTSLTVGRETWENVKYTYNRESKKIEQDVIGKFKQYPLKLAWAITIHKSQGLTFEKVIVDFGTGAFASGQAYVALSRVTSLKGLFLKQRIKSKDIFVDDEIKEFAKTFNELPEIEKILIVEGRSYQKPKGVVGKKGKDYTMVKTAEMFPPGLT
jgi:ATP-dependent exoDNAse (exonuclease V) alpha subunit